VCRRQNARCDVRLSRKVLLKDGGGTRLRWLVGFSEPDRHLDPIGEARCPATNGLPHHATPPSLARSSRLHSLRRRCNRRRREGASMGMYDDVVVLDESLHCPDGHALGRFQTKSFDNPTMATYLIVGPHVHMVTRAEVDEPDGSTAAHWRLEGSIAVYHVSPVVPTGELVFDTTCNECEPVLVRTDQHAWGDLVSERQLWVEFRATLVADQSRRIERTSGTRSELIAELREDGLRVMRDDDPLAIAHP
jgi:hypothetical protein